MTPLFLRKAAGLLPPPFRRAASGAMLDLMWAGEGRPAQIVEARGLVQINDTGAIEAAIDKLIAANSDKAAAVKEKPQAIGWFVGQVMKETGGKANPATVNELLRSKLGL